MFYVFLFYVNMDFVCEINIIYNIQIIKYIIKITYIIYINSLAENSSSEQQV